MPHALQDFSPCDPGSLETSTYSFNFAAFLAATETITSATVTIVAKNGIDGAASSRLIGPVSISGSYVLQQIGTCVAGEKYLVTATIQTSLNQTESLAANLPCNALV